jgi:nucleoside-diphosphate-sugar epimerase
MNAQGNAPVIITGGSGFIGSYLAIELMERGEDVVVFDRDYDLRRIKGFGEAAGGRFDRVKDRLTFVQGDLSIMAHVLALFDTHQPKAVYHLGALLSAGAEANATMGFQVDIVGTWHVLEAARLYCQQRGKPPIKVLFPSTIASFGEHISPELKNNVPNEAPQFPTTIYGVAKLSSERLGEYYQRRGWVNFRALRFPSVIGAARGPGGTTVYSTLMIQLPAEGKSYEVYVGEDLRLAILYVKDAVAALLALHDADEAKLGSSDMTTRRVFNLRGILGKDGLLPPTAREIADVVRKRLSGAQITFKPDAAMEKTVAGFGILEDHVAQQEWLAKGTLQYLNLADAVNDFLKEVDNYPARLKRLELYG